MADSIMVANVGEAAVSGVSLVDQIMVLLINIFAALATGGAVVAGQYLGQKNKEQACKSTTQLMWSMGFISLVITAFVYACKYWILHGVFGQIEADVMHHADVYLLIVTASIPFIALYNGGAAVFRAMGNSKVSMNTSLIMNLVNIVGNAILIYGFHMEIAGAAIPTLISRIVAAVVIVVRLGNQDLQIHIDRPFKLKFDWRMIKKILRIGIPNSLENSMFQLGKILVLTIVTAFGTRAITANAVSNTIAMFQILPGMAICQAILTVSSQCVGANDYKQLDFYIKRLMKTIYVFVVAINVVVVAILPLILKAYNLSSETTEIAKQIIWYHAICTCTIWPLSFALPNLLRAANDVMFTMIVAILSMWIFRIGASVVIAKWLGLGVLGVWIAMTIDWFVRAIIFVIRYKYKIKSKCKI